MTVFQYKVASSVSLTFEADLNAAGAQGWELIVADDGGLLVYKKSAGSPNFKYKVLQVPPFGPVDLQTAIQPLGAQGWEVIIISATKGVVLLKQPL